MATATRFPQGLTTFPQRSLLASYPVGTSPSIISLTEDFLPYRSGDYTLTQTNGAVTQVPWLGGLIKLATTGGSASDAVYLSRLGQHMQFLPLNRLWFDIRLAYVQGAVAAGSANDTTIYAGLFDNANPASATNGVYFIKPAGGTSVNFVIKKASTSTTFQNVADLAEPSGILGDAVSTNGTLNATIAGNAFTAVSVATPGAGYQASPLVLTTSTAGGTLNSTPVMVELGSTSLGGNPSVPTQTSGLMYGSLYAPYVTTPGSGFTNSASATTLLEVEPLLNLQFMYNGKGTLRVGVNGRQIFAITASGAVAVTAGNTINLSTSVSPSFLSATALAAAVAPVAPAVGGAYNLVPQVALSPAFGFLGSTANARALFIDEFNVAVELN